MPSISERELERLRANVAELSTLNDIATAINLLMSTEDITRTILDNCLRRIPAAQGAVFLIEDNKADTPMFRTFIRESADTAGVPPLHFNWSLLGWMSKNKQLLLMNDPAHDDRFAGIDFHSLGISSVLAAPLLAQSGLIGALVLFNSTASDGFGADDKRFLGIVGSQTAKVIENARLFEKERELLVLEEEMKLARSIQEGYLPRTGFKTPCCEILGYNSPAKAVGGDYFDMFSLDKDRVVVSIGDVAGKGIGAALLASEAQAVIRSLLRQSQETSLEEAVRFLSDLFVEMTRADQYVTAFIAVYDGSRHTLTYINGGHIPPVVVSADGRTALLPGANLVVGALNNTVYESAEYRLAPGDLVFFCTDGITENFSPEGEEYGYTRLESFLVGNWPSSLENVRDRLLEDLREFRRGDPQSDDITLLMLRVE
jgi:sigma-B regulation protein RsbU (phosphoserine phosphatase)